MLDKPCARTSWLASSNCCERAASERAIDRLVTNPSMPTATALGSRRKTMSRSSGNGLNGGSLPINALTSATCPNIAGHSQAARLPSASVINSVGQRGSRYLSSAPTSKVPSPSRSEAWSHSAPWSISSSKLLIAVAWLGKSRPSRLGSWPRAITTAAPRVNPSTTEWEMKFTNAPKRSRPSNHWNTPARKVSSRIKVM